MADPASAINPFEPPKADLLRADDGAAAPPLWNPNAAGLWSVFLSPIFGSILVRENWKALDEPGKARAGAYWIAASIVMAILAAFIGLLGFAYLIIWYFAWQKPQAVHIRERWGSAYPRRGWAAPVFIALGVWVLVVMAVYLSMSAFFAASR